MPTRCGVWLHDDVASEREIARRVADEYGVGSGNSFPAANLNVPDREAARFERDAHALSMTGIRRLVGNKDREVAMS